MTQAVALTSLVIFVVLMAIIGVTSMKKAKTMSDFLLGGRNVGAWMSAFAYGTTYFSAVIFIGYAGKTGWQIGIGGVLIGIGNALLGSLLAWKILAKRTRSMTHRLNSSTMPEFFQARYQSRNMKIFAAIIIFIFLLPYSASVYMGLGYLFNSIFPSVAYIYCMLFIAVLTAVYLVAGGYVATVITDFIQGIIMIIGVVIMVASIVNNPAVGGLSAGFSKLASFEGGADLVNITGGKNWLALFSMVLLTSFGTWGLPQMIHKFYAIKDEKAINKAMVVSTVFAAIIGVGAYFAGTFGRIYLNNTVPKEGYDKIIPDMLIAAFSNGLLSNILLSVILLLVLSASMSTLAAIVLTSSSAISVDLLGEIKPNADKKKQMVFMRVLCLLFVALSFTFASLKISFIIALMSFSWGTVAGSFIGPYIWGLYWKGTTRAGAWAGMIAGVLTVSTLVVITTITKEFSAATAKSPLFGTIAMLVSIIVVPVVSMLTKKFEKQHTDYVFGENEKAGV